MGKKKGMPEFKSVSSFELFLAFPVFIVVTLLGIFMIYIFSTTIWHAIIDGYLYSGGNFRTGSYASKVSGGFKFWILIFINFLHFLLGLMTLLFGCISVSASVTELKFRFFRSI